MERFWRNRDVHIWFSQPGRMRVTMDQQVSDQSNLDPLRRLSGGQPGSSKIIQNPGFNTNHKRCVTLPGHMIWNVIRSHCIPGRCFLLRCRRRVFQCFRRNFRRIPTGAAAHFARKSRSKCAAMASMALSSCVLQKQECRWWRWWQWWRWWWYYWYYWCCLCCWCCWCCCWGWWWWGRRWWWWWWIIMPQILASEIRNLLTMLTSAENGLGCSSKL